jgi:hypothetical protein
MANNSEEGQGSQRAVVLMMMTMTMTMTMTTMAHHDILPQM